MSEEIKTAETTANAEVDSHADVDQDAAETLNEAEFTDTDNEDGAVEPPKQSKAQNSENARRRREAERQAELKRVEEAAREKAIIEALNGKNPYTNEEMKDGADVREFLTMREIENNGGDPLADFSKYQKRKEREQAEEAQKKKDKDAWYETDKAEFIARFPDVNLAELVRDEDFQAYAEGKVGTVPLSKIYAGYSKLSERLEKKAKQIAAQRIANKASSPGALSSAGSSNDGFYTEEEVRKMSTEDIKKNYDKVRESMTKWKK